MKRLLAALVLLFAFSPAFASSHRHAARSSRDERPCARLHDEARSPCPCLQSTPAGERSENSVFLTRPSHFLHSPALVLGEACFQLARQAFIEKEFHPRVASSDYFARSSAAIASSL